MTGSSTTVSTADITPAEIAGWLASGAVAILPTETVYGLAIRPGDPAAMDRVFELKGRPREVNLPVIIGSLDQLAELGADFNETARMLAEKFWPGPLTMVLGFRPHGARPEWLAGREEFAVRLPGLKLLREIALAAGPLLVTSANAHGTGAKQVAREAVESLLGAADYVVDGGTLTPVPSTIINVRSSPARIERPGAVTAADLKAFIRDGRVAAR